MKPRHPKRLHFRKVKRPAPRPHWHLHLHRGNRGSDSAGCILMGGQVQVLLIDRAGKVLQQMSAAVVELASTMRTAGKALHAAFEPLAEHHRRTGGFRCSGTLQLSEQDAAGLRKLAGW